jgi:O-antigen ligase
MSNSRTPQIEGIDNRRQLLYLLIVLGICLGVGKFVALTGVVGLAAGIGVFLASVWAYFATKAPLVLTLLVPASLLGLLLPQTGEIAIEVGLAGTAAWWAIASFSQGNASPAAIASLCVPLLWAIFLINKNVPDLHTGLLGLRKATLPFIGLALGILWPYKSRAQATKVIPWILLSAGILNLFIHLGAPNIEEGFVRAGNVYTSLFAGVHRMQGLYSGPFHVALLGVFLALFGWQQIIGRSMGRGLPFVVVGLLLTYFSEVRSGYIVIIAGVILLGVFGGTVQAGKWTRIGAQLALLACGLAIVVAFASPKDTAFTSISGLSHEQRALGRLQQWSLAGTLIVASPVYGWGPGSAGSTLSQQFENHEHVTSHDSIITFFVEGGVLGLSLVLLAGWLTLKSTRGWLRVPHPGIAAAIALLGMSLTNNIEEAAPICVILAILVGLRAEG